MNTAAAAVTLMNGLLTLAKRYEFVTQEEYNGALELIPANAMELCDLIVKLVEGHKYCLFEISVSRDPKAHEEELLRMWRAGNFEHVVKTERVIDALNDIKQRTGLVELLKQLAFIEDFWREVNTPAPVNQSNKVVC